MTITRKRLIEVALPLEAINKACAREKSIRHGHPSTLHLWWARRPLAAARAVIFAQMVDDPSTYVDVLRADAKLNGQKLTVIAWLWARTVKSPNPAFAQVDVPLASTFMLSTKAGKEAYVEPVIENGGYRFTVKVGKPKDPAGAKNGTKLSRGANFQCLMSNTPIASDHIYGEANAWRMSARAG